MFLRVGNTGLILAPGSAPRLYSFGAAPPPPPPPEGLTHTVSATYVDSSGVVQDVAFSPASNPGITIPQYAHLRLSASGCLSVETDADTELEAWSALGHSWDSGEGLSGTWQYGGGDRNLVDHDPINAHVYTTAGTFTLRHWARDSAGRQSLASLTVTVTARSGGTLITEGGSWPTWVSNTVYRLAAGTNHTAKGAINLSGLHNVVILKDGAESDPIVGTVNWHNVFVSNALQTRTRGCVLVGIDASNVSDGITGSLFCGSVFGRARQYNMGAAEWYWINQASTQTERDNIRRPRGNFFWSAGLVNSNSTNYCYIGESADFTSVDTDWEKTAGTSAEHVFRGWFRRLILRNSRFRSESGTALMSYNKLQGSNNGTTLDVWPADDRLGVWNGAIFRPVAGQYVLSRNVYGASGANNSVGTNIEVMPENNEALPAQAIEMASVNNNVWFVSSFVGLSVAFHGRNMRYFNNRLTLGAGGEVPYVTSLRPVRVPAGWDGPYITTAPPVVIK